MTCCSLSCRPHCAGSGGRHQRGASWRKLLARPSSEARPEQVRGANQSGMLAFDRTRRLVSKTSKTKCKLANTSAPTGAPFAYGAPFVSLLVDETAGEAIKRALPRAGPWTKRVGDACIRQNSSSSFQNFKRQEKTLHELFSNWRPVRVCLGPVRVSFGWRNCWRGHLAHPAPSRPVDQKSRGCLRSTELVV